MSETTTPRFRGSHDVAMKVRAHAYLRTAAFCEETGVIHLVTRRGQ